MNIRDEIQKLYVGYLGRAADQPGLNYWETQIERGSITLDQLRLNLINDQPEYLEMYGGLSRLETATKIYQNLFDRPPDDEGLDYWVKGGGSVVSIDQLILAYFAGAQGSDIELINHKIHLANYYTQTSGYLYSIETARKAIEADMNLGIISTEDLAGTYNLVGFTIEHTKSGMVIDSDGVHIFNPYKLTQEDFYYFEGILTISEQGHLNDYFNFENEITQTNNSFNIINNNFIEAVYEHGEYYITYEFDGSTLITTYDLWTKSNNSYFKTGYQENVWEKVSDQVDLMGLDNFQYDPVVNFG